jgi:hypothetical protein
MSAEMRVSSVATGLDFPIADSMAAKRSAVRMGLVT